MSKSALLTAFVRLSSCFSHSSRLKVWQGSCLTLLPNLLTEFREEYNEGRRFLVIAHVGQMRHYMKVLQVALPPSFRYFRPKQRAGSWTSQQRCCVRFTTLLASFSISTTLYGYCLSLKIGKAFMLMLVVCTLTYLCSYIVAKLKAHLANTSFESDGILLLDPSRQRKACLISFL